MKVSVNRQKQAASDGYKDCCICGSPLIYDEKAEEQKCTVCGATHISRISCTKGHFVCDGCHAAGVFEFLMHLEKSVETDPIQLMQQLMRHPSVHLHGPEHHSMVPCVLLTVYRNCGGEIDLGAGLKEAVSRGRQVPGGTCGYWGACGAAIGAGIYASIVTGSTPLSKEAWPVPNKLTARCLEKMAEIGGPRCCKRTSYIALETAAEFSAEVFGIKIPIHRAICNHHRINRECIRSSCPYFRLSENGIQ